MFDFGIGYCYKLYNQIKNLYQIKNIIDIIYIGIYTNQRDDIQIQHFESLKTKIFSCGSLYIKFLQWYISKLKSNIVNKKYKIPNVVNDDSKNENDTDNDIDDYIDDDINSKNKLIQFISYFEDIFEQCPYHDIEHTKQIFVNSMNGITLENYIDISTFRQIASGSIGQVYYAKRFSDNLEIAIKVKHPNIEEDLENQKELIKFIKIIQYIPFIKKRYNLYFNIDDFLSDINLQCDFNNEANNCKQFQDNFKESKNYIIFPKIIYQSNDLLISEYIEGELFDNLTDMQKYQTSLNFICFFYQMLLVDNFLHGDLHCKNWKVRLNKETNIVQIIVYDCGICFQNTSLELTNTFWFALMNYDIDKINKSLRQFILEMTNNINDKELEKNITILFNVILKESIGASVIFKLIIEFFKLNNIIVHKFLLNLSILVCVIEEFLKSTNLVDRDKSSTAKQSSMFELMNESQLDVIAFCDVKKCYPEVRNLFNLHIKDKHNYKNYKINIDKHNIKEIINTEKQLFNSLSLTKLKFKPPQ